MRFGKYLKAAFLNHWNLLAFLGGCAFALISPAPDVLLPVVAAGEIAYLGMLGTHPKFQKYVEAQEAKKTRAASSVSTQQTLERITSSLPKELFDRFVALKTRCLELQQIAGELKQTGSEEVHQPFENYQIAGLDRLLWIHLRLLYTQYALYRFLKQTSEEQIRADIKRLETELSRLPASPGGDQQQRVRKALEDNLQTSQRSAHQLAASPRQLRIGKAGNRPTGKQDPLAQRNGCEPTGAGLHLRTGRSGGGQHAGNREDHERAAVRDGLGYCR